MKIGFYLSNSSKNSFRLVKKSDMGREVGQKWPQKFGYHMWMAPKDSLLTQKSSVKMQVGTYIILGTCHEYFWWQTQFHAEALFRRIPFAQFRKETFRGKGDWSWHLPTAPECWQPPNHYPRCNAQNPAAVVVCSCNIKLCQIMHLWKLPQNFARFRKILHIFIQCKMDIWWSPRLMRYFRGKTKPH